MKVLTEMQLREAMKTGPLHTCRVDPGTIVTPSARAFLAEKGIQLVIGDEVQRPGHEDREAAPAEHEPGARFACLPCGGVLAEKPEFMTHLRGNRLVPKLHPRIRLRGQIDATEGLIIQAQVLAQRGGLPELVKHLSELLDYTRQVLRAEVLDGALPDMNIMGMSAAEVRAVSHDPASSLGIKHILPSYEMGEVMSWLNLVRTGIRQAELLAVEAFWPDQFSEPSRQDIIQALNRLSSVAYVMMCRLAAGKYAPARGR
ncbi:MAG: cobalamin adenosyltransferase [Firmicutes bacterium]|nr:cobalamin adenosyltransferase [Bacillota bacterium]